MAATRKDRGSIVKLLIEKEASMEMKMTVSLVNQLLLIVYSCSWYNRMLRR
jgi:hypothetical protein